MTNSPRPEQPIAVSQVGALPVLSTTATPRCETSSPRTKISVFPVRESIMQVMECHDMLLLCLPSQGRKSPLIDGYHVLDIDLKLAPGDSVTAAKARMADASRRAPSPNPSSNGHGDQATHPHVAGEGDDAPVQGRASIPSIDVFPSRYATLSLSTASSV